MRSLVSALLLSIALPGTSWSQEAGPLRPWGPAASLLFAPAKSRDRMMLMLADTTAGQIRPTYWKEGAIAGGVVVGLLGAAAGGGLCAYSETQRNCTGATLLGAIAGSLAGGTIGALIGGQFNKAEPSRAPVDSTTAKSLQGEKS
jgi:hypothetical protein